MFEMQFIYVQNENKVNMESFITKSRIAGVLWRSPDSGASGVDSLLN